MSYWDVALMAEDEDLRKREAAAYAQEPNPAYDPIEWATQKGFLLAASPGWDAAWASALAGGNPAPGRDAGVITDGMILSAVQGQLPQLMPPTDPMLDLPTGEPK
jgi:hypothetical protein